MRYAVTFGKCGPASAVLAGCVLAANYRIGVLVQSVAIIGSFRQRYTEVLDAWRTFTGAGLQVTSPLGEPVVEPGIPFVRFASDRVEHSNSMVQTIALHRIMSADFTFVVAPDGYVGRTTSYEVGRLLQAGLPLYFSASPDDLPLRVPQSHLAQPRELVEQFAREEPTSWHADDAVIDEQDHLERALLTGDLREL